MPASVLIVGAGPTGLTAALELSRFDVPVRVVDKRAAPADTSRAIGVHARTLELLHQRGLADELIRAGNPTRGGSVSSGGKRLFELNLGQIDSPFPMLLIVSQVETERVLRAAVERQGVAIEWGVELVGLAREAEGRDAQADPVRATLRHADGRLELAEAAYLIGAEGAHSVARSTVGLDFAGHTRAEHYSLGDFHLDGDLPADEFHLFAAEDGFLAMFPLAPGHFRMIASHHPDDPQQGEAPTLGELQGLYDRRSHVPGRLHDLAWSSRFRINSRMVPHLRAGRCFLGGDSAHVHSPAGGQGMNTGIQDMINLGWKLALVLKGQASPELLDTYDADRLPVIRDVLSGTDRLTNLIESENPVVRGLFTHLAPWVVGLDPVQHAGAARMSQIGLNYRASPLSAQWGAIGGLHAGDRVPDIPVQLCQFQNRKNNLYRLLDQDGFVLFLTRPESDEATAACRDEVRPYRDLIHTWEVQTGDLGRKSRFTLAFGSDPGAFLVRPDGYVGLAATGPDAAHHLGDYCRRWLAVPPK